MPDQSQFVVNPETGDIGVEDEEQGMSIPLDHAQSVDGQVVGQVQTNPETGDQGIEDDTHGVSRPFDPVEYAQEVE